MAYEALARKWRPKTFDEIVGQGHVTRALANAITSGKIHHAYLFSGTRGVGKTTFARILARALNCEKGPTPTPCLACPSCAEVGSGTDVQEIDGASNTGIDDIRSLRENAAYAPSRLRYKVYIIDEVHMLSKQAFNGLLKTLEEPPPHVVFILATTEPNRIPDTILSRVQRFDFRMLTDAEVRGRLSEMARVEGITAEEDALALMARYAFGSMRDGQSLFEQAAVSGGGNVTAALVAFTAFQVQVISPIRNLLGQYVALRKGKASLARVFEFFDVPAEEDAQGAVAFTGVATGIVFEGVTFAYGAEGRVLDGLSLEIPAGGTFALVGESGAGKSTLVDLLLRFYEPQGGEIRLDGVPLGRFRRATLRRKIALVSTDPYLFHGSLGENVRYGAADADDSRVADAIAGADLADLVRSLPEGLSTVVGERGVALSDGQRQRVALARAFLRAPEILVLDEATSSLDLLSEERIRRAIRELMRGKTTLIVTHRVHAVRDADRIAVLSNGRVSHIGTHEDLMGQRGAYRSFLRVCGDGADGAGEVRGA